ncbi:MAG TPA: hypothetical protein PLU22_06985 [Polyangiaceae bacterium]|nr:hypothetical protein [Polyangiaceae bacterium]
MSPASPRRARRFGVNLAAAIAVVGALIAVARWRSVALRPRAPLAPAAVADPAPAAVSAPSVASAAAGASASAAADAPDPEWTAEDDALPDRLEDQRAALWRKLVKFRGVTAEQAERMRALVEGERWFGQGNPGPTQHPMTRAECRARRARAPRLVSEDRARCGARHMVPIYDPGRGQTADDATVCIDQFEFPNLPCEYPTTWVRAQIAQELCVVEGKRLCDAHEWEGACAGAVLPVEAEYAWGLRVGEAMEERRIALEHDHNQKREIRWAYGAEKDHARCGTGSRKSDGCVTPTWEKCGSNTYPAGAFPDCVSPFGAYDLHGNAAEHMNLPMQPCELARYGEPLGQTEMKGSWFIFQSYEAHIDDCRWRAPDWHGGRVLSPTSHMNYHLGFRCCKDRAPVTRPESEACRPELTAARRPEAPEPAPSASASAAPPPSATVAGPYDDVAPPTAEVESAAATPGAAAPMTPAGAAPAGDERAAPAPSPAAPD